MNPFRATHRYRAVFGDPLELVELVELLPDRRPGGRYDQAIVRFADRGVGATRVSARALIPLDACCCEYADTGDGESGPNLVRYESDDCPVHREPGFSRAGEGAFYG